MLRIVAQRYQRCEYCGEELPHLARQIFASQEGLCPRCHQLLVDWEINLDKVEVRDMSIKGRSMVVVPRVEFHSTPPKNSIPI